MRFLSLAALATSLIASVHAQVTIQNTFQAPTGVGTWFNAANWSQGIPIRGQTAIIPAGQTVRIVSSPAPINVTNIDVVGNLDVPGPAPALNLTILTDRIDVSGRFSIGSAATPLLGWARIVLTHQSIPIAKEAKRIDVASGATFLLYGDPSKKSWTRLTHGLQWQGVGSANPNNLLVQGNSLGWAAADLLAISTTDFSLNESERVTVSSATTVGPNTSLTLTAPMIRDHFSDQEPASNGQVVDMRAAVGRLNRNIQIVGDTNSTLRWGGDIVIKQNLPQQTTAHVSYVEFDQMGKYGVMGRYPLHFHECGDMGSGATAPRATVTGCSFHDCYHRALTIHQTDRVEVRDNVTYEIYGHAYFLENGSETGNLFENNLGMNTRTPIPDAANPPQFLGTQMTWPGASTKAGAYSFFRYHDQNPSTFWISNYANRFVGNVALGSEAYGFAFDMAIKDYDKDGLNFGRKTKSGAQAQFLHPFGAPGYRQFQFDDNTAGGCGRVGIFCDEEGEGRAMPAFETNGVLTAHASLTFARFTAFKCRMAGIWYRQYGEAIWSDCRFADNALGAYFASEGWTEDHQHWQLSHPGGPFHAVANWASIGAPAMSHQVLDHSLMLGDSNNTGRPGNPDWDATLGRSLPHHRDLQPQHGNPITQRISHNVTRNATTRRIWSRGVTIYDGLVGVTHTHFENYLDLPVAGGTRRAAALTVNGVGDVHYVFGSRADPWRVDPRNYTTGISFGNTQPENQVAFPAPRTPWQNPATDPLLTTMGWLFAGGLNEVVIHDLDGSLSGMGPGYVMNLNSPLLWRNAQMVTTANGSNNTPIWNHMPDTVNQVAALQVELPWDWQAAAVGITSGFRNMRLALPPPQANDRIDLYDMDAYFTQSLTAYAEKQRAPRQPLPSTPHAKRLFGTNVLIGAMDTVPPQYDLTYQNVVLGPDAVSVAVRLRFGPAGGAVIVKMPTPSSFPVQSVWTAQPPLVGTIGATYSMGATRAFPDTTNLFRLVTQHNQAANRAALNTMSGNGWWQSGNDLFLRVEMPARTVAPGADPVYTGAESILLVKFL